MAEVSRKFMDVDVREVKEVAGLSFFTNSIRLSRSICSIVVMSMPQSVYRP